MRNETKRIRDLENEIDTARYELEFICRLNPKSDDDKQRGHELADEILDLQLSYKDKYGHFYQPKSI